MIPLIRIRLCQHFLIKQGYLINLMMIVGIEVARIYRLHTEIKPNQEIHKNKHRIQNIKRKHQFIIKP